MSDEVKDYESMSRRYGLDPIAFAAHVDYEMQRHIPLGFEARMKYFDQKRREQKAGKLRRHVVTWRDQLPANRLQILKWTGFGLLVVAVIVIMLVVESSVSSTSTTQSAHPINWSTQKVVPSAGYGYITESSDQIAGAFIQMYGDYQSGDASHKPDVPVNYNQTVIVIARPTPSGGRPYTLQNKSGQFDQTCRLTSGGSLTIMGTDGLRQLVKYTSKPTTNRFDTPSASAGQCFGGEMFFEQLN